MKFFQVPPFLVNQPAKFIAAAKRATLVAAANVCKPNVLIVKVSNGLADNRLQTNILNLASHNFPA